MFGDLQTGTSMKKHEAKQLCRDNQLTKHSLFNLVQQA